MAIEALQRIPHILQGGQAVKHTADFLMNTHLQQGIDPALLTGICIGIPLFMILGTVAISLSQRNSFKHTRYDGVFRDRDTSRDYYDHF